MRPPDLPPGNLAAPSHLFAGIGFSQLLLVYGPISCGERMRTMRRDRRPCTWHLESLLLSRVPFTSIPNSASLFSSGASPSQPNMPKAGKEPIMSTRAVRKTKVKTPIRIVPLHPYLRDAAAPAPHLTYRNGPLLTNVEVFTIFWGSDWQIAANNQLSEQMNAFVDYILGSPLLDQLAEYSVPGQTIGHGKRTGTTLLTLPEPGKSVQDSHLQSMLNTELGKGAIAPANPNSLYFVFLPPGTQIKQSG